MNASIKIELPETETANDVLATLWARTRIDELSSDTPKGRQPKRTGLEIDKQITNLGLEFRLMTKFTSFVAVEDRVANPNGNATKVAAPSQLPNSMNQDVALKPNDRRGQTGGCGKNEKRRNKNAKHNPKSHYEGPVAEAVTVDVSSTSLIDLEKAGQRAENWESLWRVEATVTATARGSGLGGGMGNVSGIAVNGRNVRPVMSLLLIQPKPESRQPLPPRPFRRLPKGTTFASMLKISPNVVAQPAQQRVQIDGSSGSEICLSLTGKRSTNFRTGVANTNGKYCINRKDDCDRQAFLSGRGPHEKGARRGRRCDHDRPRRHDTYGKSRLGRRDSTCGMRIGSVAVKICTDICGQRTRSR